MSDQPRSPWRFWRGTAWTGGTWLIATVGVYFATNEALSFARPLWSLPLSVGGDFHQLLLRMTVLAGLLGPPMVVAVSSGLRLRWWHAGLACQIAGAASAAVAFGLAPNEIGFGLALVSATSWVAGAVVGVLACGIRRRGAAC